MRSVLALAATLFLLPAAPAGATPENWPACSRAAPDLRALRQCSTARADIEACETRQAGQASVTAIACLEGIVRQWTAVAEREDGFVAGADRPGWQAWLGERDGFCRNAEQMRLSAERYGEGYAGFEAAKCELQQTIRRAIDSVARQRGLR